MQAHPMNPKANAIYSLRQQCSKLELDMLMQTSEPSVYEQYQEIRMKLAKSNELDLLLDPRD